MQKSKVLLTRRGHGEEDSMSDILFWVIGRTDDESDVCEGLVVQKIGSPRDETIAVTVDLINECWWEERMASWMEVIKSNKNRKRPLCPWTHQHQWNLNLPDAESPALTWQMPAGWDALVGGTGCPARRLGSLGLPAERWPFFALNLWPPTDHPTDHWLRLRPSEHWMCGHCFCHWHLHEHTLDFIVAKPSAYHYHPFMTHSIPLFHIPLTDFLSLVTSLECSSVSSCRSGTANANLGREESSRVTRGTTILITGTLMSWKHTAED